MNAHFSRATIKKGMIQSSVDVCNSSIKQSLTFWLREDVRWTS